VLTACSSSGTRPPDARTAERRNAPEPGDIGPVASATAARTTASEAGPEAIALLPPIEVPEQASAAFSRALSAMAAEDWLTAQVELEQLAAEYPAFPGPYVNLGIIHRRDGRPDDARAALDAALAIAPDHAAANNELGILLRENGEFDAAEAAYRSAIAGDPDYALAHYNLGVLLDLYLKRDGEALQEYETFQSLVPAPDAEVARWIVDLRRRLGMPIETVQLAQGNGP